MQVWSEMEQRLHIGPPEPSSDREKEFNYGLQQIKSRLQNAVDRRRNGEEQDDIPFIDALLQSGVPDEQVIILYIIMPNKNTWGVKKVRGQEEPATKSSDVT